jgi:peptidoglycan/LPS O-acetylase OafA/YrhL
VIGGHLPILDGWRALSILLVMAGHLLPLGPQSWGMTRRRGGFWNGYIFHPFWLPDNVFPPHQA